MDVGGIAIDECSFLGVCVIGHIHNVLRCIVRPEAPTDVPFGGVPVSGRDHGRGDRRLQNCTSLALVLTCPLALLAAQVMLLGDCLQKPAPGEEQGPWFSQLVQRACDPAPFAASKRGPGTAAWTGLDMLALMPRVVLSRMMRSQGDEEFCEDMCDIRRTECAQPVSDGLVARLKEVGTAAEGAAQDPGFRFAPVGVLSKLERDTIGHEQKHAFAREFDEPLIQWRKRIVHADLMGLDEEEMTALCEVRSRWHQRTRHPPLPLAAIAVRSSSGPGFLTPTMPPSPSLVVGSFVRSFSSSPTRTISPPWWRRSSRARRRT